MLKWAKPNQRRVSECSSELSLETSSTLSSDSSESGITVPIRYHEKRASRPKSLALSSTDVLDLDLDYSYVGRRAHRTASNPPTMFASYNKANTKRHSMIVTSKDMLPKTHGMSESNNNNVLKISTGCQEKSDTGVLKISTTNCDKPKSRNTFWKNLRAKAQGKKSDRKLEKANSMSNIPAMSQQSDCKTPTNDSSSSHDDLLSTTCPSPIVMRKPQKSLADSVSPSRSRSSVVRRRSFKLIKKQNENKKPKPFTKASDALESDNLSLTGSPDSGISSIRSASISTINSEYEDGLDSPVSPITPINTTDNITEMSCLRQQFTSAVLQYLNERLEKKGYETVVDRSSSTSSIQSEDGAADIFCYDTDTVARRPSHHVSTKQTVQATR